jgi:hypothetical protein
MRTERKNFSGFMNLDDPNEVIPLTHHREANNVLFKGNPGNMRMESIPGNSSVSNADLRAGTNVCIGSYYDELKQRLFYFVYNSNGFDAIYVYAKNTGAITTLLMSKIDSIPTEPLFNFSPDYPIASVNILYRTEEDGDIIHWTDRNNRPMKLNIKECTVAGKTYSGDWKKKYLTMARLMPLLSPICKYEDDATISINNFRSKLYQFKYRWVYRDFTKSTWSPWSRLFAPADIDALATEKDPTKNNRISIVYQSGDADVVKIEIAARESIVSTFSDPFLINTITKSTSSIPDNNNIDYKFYNTEAYPYLDVAESTQLFDYVPLKANTQELLNGNIIIYGGITEGITSGITPSVTQTLSLTQNTNTSTFFTFSSFNRYEFTYIEGSPYQQAAYTSGYYLILNGDPQVGDVYNVTVSMRRDIGSGIEDISTTVSLTVVAGRNTQQLVEADLKTAVNANTTLASWNIASYTTTLQLVDPDPEFTNKRGLKFGTTPAGTTWVTDLSYSYSYVGGGGLPADPTGVNSACYKHKSRYSFGLCYFNEYGVTDGVLTSDALKVITPEISSSDLSGTQLTIPAIQFNLYHQAPSWAKYFSFVRTTNLTCSNFKSIVTLTTYKDVGAGYAYLDITDFQTNKNGWEAYSFLKGDRVRIIGLKNGSNAVNDYAILSLSTSLELGLTSVGLTDKIWLKVEYDYSTMLNFATAGYNNYYIEVYTPTVSASDENQVFYEFGETYPIIENGVNRYHTGMTQSQTASQPAIYKFIRGDIYNRLRQSTPANLWILDKSMSDKYGSKIDGNGRPFIQDPYAKQTYFPTLVRYSLEYQAGTSINQTNRFYAANFDEYDREKGDIQRLKTRGRQLRVFQNRACGVVPILQSLVQTADGNGVLSQSAEIINRIQYYLGEYGVGTQFCSLASSGQADYFSDPVRGCQVRLSSDGITPISEIYKGHFYFNPLLVKYNKERNNITGQGKAKVIAFYDQFNEEFVSCMQESTGTAPDKTVASTFGFNEFRNCYTSFYSYSPEWISTAENLVISWKNGILYTHNNTTNYANFYGVQYKPSVTLVFNQYEQLKKRYNTVTMLCNKAWIPDTNGDITTNLNQSSSLAIGDFLYKDDKLHAAFKRDASSTGGLFNGNVLKGNWMKINLKPVNGNEFVNLYYIEVANLEPFNNR